MFNSIEKSASHPAHRKWIAVFAMTALLRLLITADHDVLALNAPHDEFWHIHNAARFVWGGDYDQFAFAHLQVYSIWLTFLHLFGIPTRLAIDVAWLAAAGYLTFALYQMMHKVWIAALVFAFLAFHPYSITVFDRTLAETLLAVLCTVALAGGIDLWNIHDVSSVFRRKIVLLLYSVSFALAYHVRKEGIVLLAPLILLLCWSFFDRRRWWCEPVGRSLGLGLLVAPLIGTILLGLALAGANYAAWGMFIRHDLGAPGYQRALAALNRIDVGRTPKHVTVTAKARELAFKESPTFGALKPYFDGEPGQQIAKHSEQFTGVPGEIGNGWFYWAMRDAGARSSWLRDAPSADQKYAAIADELDQAFDAGRLARRPIGLGAFVDPDVGKWLPSLPGSWLSILRLVGEPIPGGMALPRENASPEQFAEFVAIAGRRQIATHFSMTGWIIAPEGSLVSLGDQDLKYTMIALGGKQRGDVPGAFSFTLRMPDASQPLDLHLITYDGRTGRIPIASLKTGQIAKFEGAFDGPVGIDQMSSTVVTSRIDRLLGYFTGDRTHIEMMSRVGTVFGWIGNAIWATSFLYLILILMRRRSPTAGLMVLAVAFSSVLARTALFGLLDVTSWTGLQIRYVLPAVSAFACMGALSLAGLFASPDPFRSGTRASVA